MAIGQRLVQILSERGLSPMDLVEKTGISHTTVYNWIKGVQEPTPRNREVICKALRIADSELFTDVHRSVTTPPPSLFSHGLPILKIAVRLDAPLPPTP